MTARGTCAGRHRARKSCPDPECYLREERPETTPTELPPITDADNLAGELPWRHEDHGGQGMPSEERADPRHEPVDIDAAPPGERPPTIDEQVADFVVRAAEIRHRADVHHTELVAKAFAAGEPLEFGPGIYRWACTRDGGYQRTEYAHELPPCPEGWRWSSAQVTAVGGRGKLHVSAAVVDGSEGANAATGPQSLVLEITGRGGYCTGLDVVLFARPAEVQR